MLSRGAFIYGRACGILKTVQQHMSSRSQTDSPQGVSRTPCPRCQALNTSLGTLTERFTYLRCGSCCEIWAIPERRLLRRLKVADGGSARPAGSPTL
jgi:phage FluMu protein Com